MGGWARGVGAAALVWALAPAALGFQGMAGGSGPGEAAPAAVLADGTVLQHFNSDIFTYMECKPDSGEGFWVAVPRTKVAVGDRVRVYRGTEMRDLRSERCNMTFPRIFSAWKIQINEAEPRVYGAHSTALGEAVEAVQQERVAARAALAARIPPGSIARAEGEAGSTVGELFAAGAAAAGRSVALRGEVVEDLPGQWFRVMDGTGEVGSDSVMVRHEGVLTAGDRVLITGTVSCDVVVGVGHIYPLVIDAAGANVERAAAR